VLSRAAELGSRILLAEAWEIHKGGLTSHPQRYDESFRDRLLSASDQGPKGLTEARAVRDELRHAFAKMFGSGIAAILNPASEGTPNTMARLATNPTRERGSCTRMYNMAGVPALSVPMGFDELGLPLGLQIAAAPMAEDRMYQIAAGFEAATRWSARRPEIAAPSSEGP
jgi:aspartyl-tRNA(Asn)/glutamyl-tRNA(Gln) amidotransferase subunit A